MNENYVSCFNLESPFKIWKPSDLHKIQYSPWSLTVLSGLVRKNWFGKNILSYIY